MAVSDESNMMQFLQFSLRDLTMFGQDLTPEAQSQYLKEMVMEAARMAKDQKDLNL